MLVLDLDYTLWRGNCEDFGTAQLVGPHEARSLSGQSLRLYADVPRIFAAFSARKVPIAIASASPAAQTGLRLLRGFGLAVDGAEIYRAKNKDTHLKKIAQTLKQPLSRALFLDDLRHNIRAAEALVSICPVPAQLARLA